MIDSSGPNAIMRVVTTHTMGSVTFHEKLHRGEGFGSHSIPRRERERIGQVRYKTSG